MTDILADIDDTLAEWHGSADAMRWRPEPDGGAGGRLASTVVTLTASTEGAVAAFQHLAESFQSAFPSMWFDRQGQPIDRATANILLADRSYARVALTHIRSRADRSLSVYVSTVRLGLDHGYFGAGGRLFETMVFGGGDDGVQLCWASELDALHGHRLLVDQLTLGLRGVWTEECDRMYGPSNLDARYRQRQRNRRRRKR
jgi:hypothetical protein